MREIKGAAELAREVAWQAAHNANRARDELVDIDARLGLLRLVARRQLGGIALQETETDLLSSRDRIMPNYTYLCRVASDGIGAHEDYFCQVTASTAILAESVEEEVEAGDEGEIDPSLYPHLVHTSEIEAQFREQRMHINAIKRFQHMLFQIAEQITIGSLDDYDPATAPPDKVIALKRGDEISASWIDRQSLKRAVQSWLNGSVVRPFTPGTKFEKAIVNFAALPPQPVPIRKHEDNRESIVPVPEAGPLTDKLVFEGGEEVHLVTPRSIERFGLSQGYSRMQLGSLKRMFARMASFIIPPDAVYQKLPHRFNTEVTLVETYESTEYDSKIVELWGFDPQFFIELIELADKSPTIRKHLGEFPTKNRSLLIKYIQTLKQGVETNKK